METWMFEIRLNRAWRGWNLTSNSVAFIREGGIGGEWEQVGDVPLVIKAQKLVDGILTGEPFDVLRAKIAWGETDIVLEGMPNHRIMGFNIIEEDVLAPDEFWESIKYPCNPSDLYLIVGMKDTPIKPPIEALREVIWSEFSRAIQRKLVV